MPTFTLDSTIKEFFPWFSNQPWHLPWLILGKGPSLERIREIDLSQYHICCLNDTPRALPEGVSADLTHLVDINGILRSGKIIRQRSNAVVMPWHPHKKFLARTTTLLGFCHDLTELARIRKAGKLRWYNSSTWKLLPRDTSPIVRVRMFNVCAAFHLLGMAGVKEIYTLGVDGGKEYAPAFSQMTPLLNGQKSFDGQWNEIYHAIGKFDIRWGKL